MSDELIKKEPARRIVSIDEPTTSKNEKGKSLQAANFLKKNHPELFEILPRRGGFRRHAATRRNAEQNIADSDASQFEISPPTTNEMLTSDRASIGEVLETNIRCPAARRPLSKDDRKNNTVRMCSIAISTVMMLAQRTYEDITMEHIVHTEEYLRGLRQPDGYPENVGQLLRLLTNLKKSGKIVASVNEDDNYEEENDAEHTTGMSDLIS